ncbi:MAG: hypothetical protein A2W31_01690 [Planctomycetes bacterium RBG_16_64_10]|nr:MAG: hypothetical protein A2W31_01690 [Planctomycetes bacterium RBG_16_64_10]
MDTAYLCRPVAILAVLIPMAFSSGAERTGNRFVQRQFAIGFWVDPPADERMDERYREIADANFTLVVGGFGAKTDAEIARQRELCEKYGLGLLVSRHGDTLDALPDGPACWGYGLLDEPGPEDFAELARKGRIVRECRPGKLAFSNLLPNYARRWRHGGSYEDYVRRFCEVVDPDVLCMDHYPHFRPDRDGRDGYCDNLATLREYALNYDIPMWNFFNAMPFQDHTDPTEAQIRWQVFTSLAHGARGVLYFCYQTIPSWEFPKGNALIARDGSKTHHWYQAQRINAQLRAWGPTLMRLKSTLVYRIAPGQIASKVLEFGPLQDIVRAERDPHHDFLVGLFDHEDGRQAVLVNNYHYAYSAWPTLAFRADSADVVELDQGGREIPLHDDSPDLEGWQFRLDAGAGRLFLMPRIEVPKPQR